MHRFFRAQEKGITFEAMIEFASEDGGDGYSEGLCVCMSAAGTDGGNAPFGGSLGALNADDEIVVLEGIILHEIYDGYRIRPTAEIARFPIREWERMVESGEASEYERW